MEKINVAELLRNCLSGMELDCTLFNNVTFNYVVKEGIWIKSFDSKGHENEIYLDCEGCLPLPSLNSVTDKCVIFPKGKTTWKGFVPPREFKDGDIIFTHSDNYNWVSIFKQFSGGNKCYTYIDLCIDDNDLFPDTCSLCNIEDIITQRLATEEETQKLFDAIKAKGYKWNAETKTLIRLVFPKFRESDWVIDKQGLVHQIENVVENVTNHTFGYDVVGGGYFNDNSDVRLWTIKDAKDGDVLAAHECLVLFKKLDGLNIKCYCTYHFMDNQSFYVDTLQNKDAFHPATEEEKKKLFDAIKENGYRWNPENKTLEKFPIFKVGDKVKEKQGDISGEIIDVQRNKYNVKVGDKGFYVYFREQDNYELAPDKFDINTLIPFESRVLMRSSNAREWTGTIFSHYSNNKFYGCGMCCDQCIPYEGNEHLLGKTDDCDEFYRTWRKTGD